MIIKCKCENEFQDARYGKTQRVHNATMKDSAYRCTVCTTINNSKEGQIIKKKDK
jgi:hypothetical protein